MSAPLARSVRTLGWVSLLTDVASEMIYPLLPRLLTRGMGAGPAVLGVIEGLAEATASLVKLASGWWSDRLARRKPLVVAGYGIAALARPLLAVAATPGHVLALRFADRVGKGARGAPRDALIAQDTPVEERGRAYGFHRAMDHLGAAVGPLTATAALAAGAELRTVFALAAIPGALSVGVLVFGLTEASSPRPDVSQTPTKVAVATPALRTYLTAVALFTLGNSADAFLLLRAEELGVGAALVPLLWTVHQLVKAALGTHGGALADNVGRRPAIAAGWAAYAVVYAGFAAARRPLHIWALFALYGAHHALSEGAEKAYVAELAAEDSRGTAFGWYHAVSGATLLPASVLTGWLWQSYGAEVALGLGAGLALAACVLLGGVDGRATSRSEVATRK